MRTVHVVSHTHWDREWYRTFQQFRLRLVHLVDGLLELLAADPAYRCFMLDGQTIVLSDYLLVRPEAEPALKRFVNEGRVLIGPWHVLPDMFLVGPESHIRNLLEGERQARRFGRKMSIGYMPDSFGHIGQMPQILHGFGIDSACLWRGLDDQPIEFWWQSPDGSRVLMLYLRDSYSNGAVLNAGVPVQFAEQLQQAAASLQPHSAVPDVLVMFGTDHMEPPPQTSAAVRFANDHIEKTRVLHSTLPRYLASVSRQLSSTHAEIPVVTGELRSSRRSHLLAGVLSTRMWIKQRNHACEQLLEKWAEPFSTFACLAGTNDCGRGTLGRPAPILQQAWRLLMECHPHDSICGCSIDQVHDEMKPRFAQVEQIGEEITRQSLDVLASLVNTVSRGDGPAGRSAVVVFNPVSVSRTDVVRSEIVLPPGMPAFEIVDEDGNLVPHQSLSGKPAELVDFQVRRDEIGGLLGMVNGGRVGNLAIRDLKVDREGATLHVLAVFAEDAEPDTALWESALASLQGYLADTTIELFHVHARSPESANVTFVAPNVPALGWKTFFIRPMQRQPLEVGVAPWMRLLAGLAQIPLVQRLVSRRTPAAEKRPYSVQNDLMSIVFNDHDMTLTLIDKVTGKVLHGLNQFVDTGDCGDTYNFCPPPVDTRQSAPRLIDLQITRGPVQQRLTASLALAVPRSLNADRNSRSEKMVDLSITTTITLTRGVHRVDIHTRVNNRAQDHRLRVHFPAGFAVDAADYDGHFEIVSRRLGVPPHDASWIEEPRPEVPQRAFTSIGDGSWTFTIGSRGLPEVEVLPAGAGQAGSEIAITLLRCVGWLSRDDLQTRKGPAGPFIATPGAQMAGEWDFDYSIIGIEDSVASRQQAWNFQSPFRSVATGTHPGRLRTSGSFVQVSDPSFVISAVKQAEAASGWIVRGFNSGDQEIRVAIKPWARAATVRLANLAEQPTEDLRPSRNGTVTFRAKPHEIVTILFSE